MKTRLTFVLGTLVTMTAAVGCADQKPAQDPSMTTATPVENTNATTTTSSTPERAPANPATPATPATKKSATTETPIANDTTPMTTGAPAPNTPSDAPVTNNPGSADQTKAADNTKVNERDRSKSALTPMDQGSSGNETKITAAIRKGIMDDKNMSFTAKNVKVITVGSKVTLRGPVKSDQEKNAIADLAKKTFGVTEVDNQLEVKK